MDIRDGVGVVLPLPTKLSEVDNVVRSPAVVAETPADIAGAAVPVSKLSSSSTPIVAKVGVKSGDASGVVRNAELGPGSSSSDTDSIEGIEKEECSPTQSFDTAGGLGFDVPSSSVSKEMGWLSMKDVEEVEDKLLLGPDTTRGKATPQWTHWDMKRLDNRERAFSLPHVRFHFGDADPEQKVGMVLGSIRTT